jgi:hypothetical protein
VLPVLLAVMTAVAGGFAFLHFTRPNAGDLGQIRVVVAEDGKADPNALTVYVAEAPFVQKDTVSPGSKFSGVVNYAAPYRLPPNLKVTATGRQYDVLKQDETGFTWAARPKLDDLSEAARKLPDADRLVDRGFELLAGERARPGIVYEDFTWEAKGLRAPASALPPRPYEQAGTFQGIHKQEGVVPFPIPYAGPPNVHLGGRAHCIVLVEVTPAQFRWRSAATEAFGNDGEVTWTARGLLPAGEPKK